MHGRETTNFRNQTMHANPEKFKQGSMPVE